MDGVADLSDELHIGDLERRRVVAAERTTRARVAFGYMERRRGATPDTMPREEPSAMNEPRKHIPGKSDSSTRSGAVPRLPRMPPPSAL